MGKKNNLFRNDPGAIGHPYTKEKKKKRTLQTLPQTTQNKITQNIS